ncbi:MAG: hypothetical protein ACLPXZ_29840 [Mycobacterium sp.]
MLLVPAYVSPKSVPPTATLYGVEAKELTLIPYSATVSFKSQSVAAAPPSPAPTKTATPAVTASWYKPLMYEFSDAPSSTSDQA